MKRRSGGVEVVKQERLIVPSVRVRTGLLCIGFFGLLSTGLCCSIVQAQEYASKQRGNAALGHYARARAMLVEALAEFEQGRKYARPDMLLDPEEWRLNIVSRTEELNRIIDPRPRVTRDGVQFKANKLLIRREKDRTPVVADGARDRNSYGENDRTRELQQTRARLESAPLSPAEQLYGRGDINAPSKPAVNLAPGADQGAAKVNTLRQVVREGISQQPPGKSQASLIFDGDPTVDAPQQIGKAVAPQQPETAVVVEEEEEVAVTGPGDPKQGALFGEGAAKSDAAAKPGAAKITVKEVTKTVGSGGFAGNEEGGEEDPKSNAIEAAIQERLNKNVQQQPVVQEEVLEEEDAGEQ